MSRATLHEWLAASPASLARTVESIAAACARIAEAVSLGALADVSATARPYHGARAFEADPARCALACIERSLAECTQVAAWSAAHAPGPTTSDLHGHHGEHLVVFDPLDGAGHLDANATLGTIFAVLPHPFRGTPPGDAGFLQPGSRQLAAGYAIYGPAAMLMLSCGGGVAAFTLDRRRNEWICTRTEVQLPANTRELAIDVAEQRLWDKPVQRYVAECLAGEAGPRARDFAVRWDAAMVARIHPVFARGGVLLCPRAAGAPPARRTSLLHRIAPLAMLVERAGGCAVTGSQSLLALVPDTLHHDTPAILGSRNEVALIVDYHAQPEENVNLPLFNTRTLFIQPRA